MPSAFSGRTLASLSAIGYQTSMLCFRSDYLKTYALLTGLALCLATSGCTVRRGAVPQSDEKSSNKKDSKTEPDADGGKSSGADNKECNTGDEGCECYGNSTCNDDLECNKDEQCVDPSKPEPKSSDGTSDAGSSEPEPTSAEPEPTSAEPAGAEPEPTSMAPEPTSAAPEPASAEPEPSTAMPEPAAEPTPSPEPAASSLALVPAGGWIEEGSNDGGVQGSFFVFDDGYSTIDIVDNDGVICIDGSTAEVVDDLWDVYWGVGLGLNLNQLMDETEYPWDGSAYSGLSFNVTGTYNRMNFTLRDFEGTGEYCVEELDPGSHTIRFSTLQEECWDPSGVTPSSSTLADLGRFQWMLGGTADGSTYFSLCIEDIQLLP